VEKRSGEGDGGGEGRGEGDNRGERREVEGGGEGQRKRGERRIDGSRRGETREDIRNFIGSLITTDVTMTGDPNKVDRNDGAHRGEEITHERSCLSVEGERTFALHRSNSEVAISKNVDVLKASKTRVHRDHVKGNTNSPQFTKIVGAIPQRTTDVYHPTGRDIGAGEVDEGARPRGAGVRRGGPVGVACYGEGAKRAYSL
jgi:hypothetical protein